MAVPKERKALVYARGRRKARHKREKMPNLHPMRRESLGRRLQSLRDPREAQQVLCRRQVTILIMVVKVTEEASVVAEAVLNAKPDTTPACAIKASVKNIVLC